MSSKKSSKTKIHLRPAEELVPREDWFSFFIKVSKDVHKELGTTSFSNGYRHDDATYWVVLVYCALNGKATQAGSDELNDRLYEQMGKPRQCIDQTRM